MKTWFYTGGTLFMSILSLLFVLILAVATWYAIRIARGKPADARGFRKQLAYVKSLGLFTMITGIMAQLIGLYSAFAAIEEAADISPGMIFSGLKVSMTTTLTGITIYLISIALWFLLDIWYLRKISGRA